MPAAIRELRRQQRMRLRRNATGRSVAVLCVTALILAAALEYSIVTLEDQISGLKQSGRSACQFAKSEFSMAVDTITNVTQTLQQQIQSDRSIIATLNTTQPAGHQGIIATLNNDIMHDQKIELGIANNFTSIGPSPFNIFCATVSQP